VRSSCAIVVGTEKGKGAADTGCGWDLNFKTKESRSGLLDPLLRITGGRENKDEQAAELSLGQDQTKQHRAGASHLPGLPWSPRTTFPNSSYAEAGGAPGGTTQGESPTPVLTHSSREARSEYRYTCMSVHGHRYVHVHTRNQVFSRIIEHRPHRQTHASCCMCLFLLLTCSLRALHPLMEEGANNASAQPTTQLSGGDVP
jgi:hypothetical protein